VSYDRAIGYNQQAAFGHLRKCFDRALNIGGMVADLFGNEFNSERWREQHADPPRSVCRLRAGAAETCQREAKARDAVPSPQRTLL
jgi:hypothetical protein